MMKILPLLLILTIPASAKAEEPVRDILKSELAREGVARSFRAAPDWFPYPDYEDRQAWSRIFGSDSAAVVSRAEKLIDYKWQYIPATAYLAFERKGDRAAMENVERANRNAFNVFLFAELAEGKGRFLDQLIDGVYLACQQPSWVLSAHQPSQASGRSLPDGREHLIDLASGRTGATLSLIYHFFHKEFDKVDPSISIGLKDALKRNILDSFLDPSEGKANWWMARDGKNFSILNNWTPWCTADTMLAFFLMEDDQERLDEAVRLSVQAVDAFLNYIKPDGACEEGPGYWGAAAGKTCNYLQLMYDASRGAFNLFGNDRIRRFGEYISRSYVGNGYVVNFADASARISSSAAQLIYSYGKALDSREMKDFALYLCAGKSRFDCGAPTGTDSYRYLEAFRFIPSMRAEADSLNALASEKGFGTVRQGLRKSVPLFTWYPDTQMCFVRNDNRWFLGTKGGFNDESHNHNDIGTCILYVRDIPVFADAGVGTYTRATFNKDMRYGIWTMQGRWHNLPMPNGVDEKYGRKYKAGEISVDEAKRSFSIDLSEAYPDSAGVKSFTRTYRLYEKSLKIRDDFSLLTRTAPDEEHFLVKGKVTPVSSGKARLECEGASFLLTYPASMTLRVEEKIIDDAVLGSVWGESLGLIRLISDPAAPVRGHYDIELKEL